MADTIGKLATGSGTILRVLAMYFKRFLADLASDSLISIAWHGGNPWNDRSYL